jgi:broad specificity phosphatase PhoE
MTTFYLIRHGAMDWLGKGLAGRLPNVHLNTEGRQQAKRLAETLAKKGIDRIVSSHLERAMETAEPLAKRLGLEIENSIDIIEIEFGEWTGAMLTDLAKSKHWELFNSFRGATRPPKGETMVEVQNRFVKRMLELRAESPYGKIALFSHGDPIRTALCYWLGMPIDFYNRIEISPGSYSVIRIHEHGVEVMGMNIVPSGKE